MKPFRYERLAQALLAEAVGGFYQEGKRFLSYRRICRMWNVSQPTAEAALRELVDHHILSIKPQSGYIMKAGFRSKALYQLGRVTMPTPLEPVPGWTAKRANLLKRREHPAVAVIFDVSRSQELVSGSTPAEFLRSSPLDCAKGCIRAAAKTHCQLEFFAFTAEEAQLAELNRRIEQKNFDGVILFRRRLEGSMKSVLQLLLANRIPLVSVFNDCEGTEAFVLDFNNIGAGDRAARIFREAGLQRMAVVTPRIEERLFSDRVAGFLGTKKSNDAGMVEIRKFTVSAFNMNSVRFLRWLREGQRIPTGIYLTAHYPMNILAPFLRKARLKIPRDLSILMTSSRSMVAGLPREFDLLKLDFEAIGERAVELMEAILSGEAVPKVTLFDLPHERHGSIITAEE